MLEQLFGSKTRVKLLNFFLRNNKEEFYVRELSRTVDGFLNSIRLELDKLEKMQILHSRRKERRKYYKLNTQFFLKKELKNLFFKSAVIFENSLVDELKKIGSIDYLAFSGFFTGVRAETDLLIVGNKIDKIKLRKILKDFSKNFGQLIRYTVMTSSEFKYRRDIRDSFLWHILEGRKIEIIDKIK